MSSVEKKTPNRVASPLLPTIPSDRLAQADYAAAIGEEEALDAGYLGFTGRVFTQTCLPYRDPMASDPNLRAWERRNGAMSVAVEPARITNAATGNTSYEMPFGKYPRLILPWLTTQIVRKQSDREADGRLQLEFSASLPKFLQDLGQAWGGRKGQLVMDQVPRLFGARISVTETAQTSNGQGVRTSEYTIARGYQLWWDSAGNLAADGLWGNTVVLSAEFVQDILDTPIPVDLRSVALMSKYGPMAMDILAWLNYRLPSAKRSSLVTWAQLHAQFGAQYAQVRQFKAAFVSKLPAVHTVYRDARFTVEDEGLRIFPSPPAVQRSAVSSK